MRHCFESTIKAKRNDECQKLIVERHASHVSTVQLLGVGAFCFLKQNYKTLLAHNTRFTTYNIDKADFIALIQMARQQGITA